MDKVSIRRDFLRMPVCHPSSSSLEANVEALMISNLRRFWKRNFHLKENEDEFSQLNGLRVEIVYHGKDINRVQLSSREIGS